MPINKQDFLNKKKENSNFVIWERINTDTITPVSCLLNIAAKYNHYCLFESVTGGEKKGRYSILAFDPDMIWKCENKTSYISKQESLKDFDEIDNQNIFSSLKNFIRASKMDLPDELPDMSSGIFGFMGYDMVKLMENLPDDNPANIDIPDGVYFRPKTTIVFDNITDRAFLSFSIYKDSNLSFEEFQEYVDNTKNSIFSNNSQFKYSSINEEEIDFNSHVSRQEFDDMVNKSIEYIKAGDIFQIVPSRRFSADFKRKPTSFYRSLRSLNPSPYLFILNIEDYAIIGSSPEILVKAHNGEITVRPLAGTRKRGKNEEEDKNLEKDLLNDKKEIAEHLMLLDLGRNDVGRVCKAGSISVSEQMTIERYSHVMHIVSNVSGLLDDNKYDYMDALIAGFPAGTVSGAPKIRAMEIIDEIEAEKRQFYAGTVGYFSATGNMDTCIALRTALIKDNKIYVQAGAGVVYDSIPENEYLETENKAMALIKASKQAISYE